MNRRYYLGIASVLYFVCFVAFSALIANSFEIINPSNKVKIISAGIGIASGYLATLFLGFFYNNEKSAQSMRYYLSALFLAYVIMLADFTLIDDNFGRNIFNILEWDKQAFKQYIDQSTNIVPFATVRLFINGYLNDNLTLTDTVINLLGNFAAFMPIPFFINVFSHKEMSFTRVLLTVALSVIAVELLQFIFLTGSSDIDDLILNTVGAVLFYTVSKISVVSKGISKLTFGVWKVIEGKA